MTVTPDTQGAFAPVEMANRRAVSLQAARRRSALIARLRLGLWGAAGLMVVLTLTALLIGRGDPAAEIVEGGDPDVVTIENPRFTGRDQSGLPLVVTAANAVRRLDEAPNVTRLELPALQIDPENTDPGSDPTAASAARGVYDAEANTLELIADVDLTTRSGYAFETSRALIDLETKDAQGDQPVRAEGPIGTIEAERWRFQDDGRILHFEGGVRTRVAEARPAEPQGDREE